VLPADLSFHPVKRITSDKVTYKAGETDGLDVIIEIVEIVFST